MPGQLRVTTGRNRTTPQFHGRPVLRLGAVVNEPQGFQVTTNTDGTGSGAMPPPPPQPAVSNWQLWLVAAVGAYFLAPKLFKK